MNKKYPDRAIKAFVDAAKEDRLSPLHYNKIMKYKDQNLDVSEIEDCLKSKNPYVRKMSAKLIGEFGDVEKIIEIAKNEEESFVLQEIIFQMSKKSRKTLVEELSFLLDSDDKAIKNSVISMFRKTGRSDCLISLLFDDNDELVEKIKDWMKETDNNEENSGS